MSSERASKTFPRVAGEQRDFGETHAGRQHPRSNARCRSDGRGGEGRGGIGNGWNRFARNPPLAAVQELKSRCASGRPTFQAPRRASGLFFRRIARLERGRTPPSSGSLQPASFLCRRRALLAPGRRYSTTSSLASARVGISA